MNESSVNEYWSAQMAQAYQQYLHDISEPHVTMRPTIARDGNAWLCIYGDLPTGVAGCGESPEAACKDFDRAWRATK